MKAILKTATILASLVLTLMLDIDVRPEAPLQVQIGMVPEAHAVLGTRRRSFRRGVIVGASAASASQASASQQQQQTSQQQAAPPPAPPQPAAAGQPLPLGTVVQSLPAGCTPTPVGGVEYYYCGGNFYRAVFQANTLVYVTAKP
jgi:hypothetical protein